MTAPETREEQAARGRMLAREALAQLEAGRSTLREGHAMLARAMMAWPRLGYEYDGETLYAAGHDVELCAKALARVLADDDKWQDGPLREVPS